MVLGDLYRLNTCCCNVIQAFFVITTSQQDMYYYIDLVGEHYNDLTVLTGIMVKV